jgi:fatty acid desaturase
LIVDSDDANDLPIFQSTERRRVNAQEHSSMSKVIVALDSFTPEQRRQFQQLTKAPPIAWPTATLCALLTIIYLGVYYFCGTGQAPLWIGTILNSIIGYVAFSVIHDSIHRAVSTNTRFNDAVGQLGLILVLPYVDMRMFRWAHILHHRFASGPKDPDIVLHGPAWSLPFRWMFIDGFYFIHALRHGDKVSKPFLRFCLVLAAIVAVAVAALTWAGFGPAVLMLWFIPSRLILLALGFSFFWLPHVPHDVSQEQNFTRATTIREGFEWFMNPALQYQNFHLIHHLYPMTPFYNNGKVWRLLEGELRKKDLAIQHGFSIKPTIYPGPAHAI